MHFVDSSLRLSAIMLGRMRMGVQHAIRQYETIGDNVFGRPRHFAMGGYTRPKYRSQDMVRALKQVIEDGCKEEYDRLREDKQEMRLRDENEDACRT